MRIVEETTSLLDKFPHSHMRKLLSVDAAHLRDLLEAFCTHHRVARSLDFLGSMLKVVAGTPDARDLERSRFTETQLINAHNRQVEINNRVQSQINQLTVTVNTILKAAKDSQIDSGHLYETLLARDRMLMMELQNLMLAVTLAKLKIVSPNILDHADLKSVWLEEPTDTPIGDLMSVSSVKVLQSVNALHFIIRFPKIKFSCKKIIIFPVEQKGFTLRIDDNIIAECDGGIYMVENCTASPGASFCRLSSESSCARELHAGGVAHCETQPSNLGPVTYVDDGIVIVNDQPAKVQVDNGTEVWIRGTHLITFDERATINGTSFTNRNNVRSKVPGVARFPLLNITANQNVLSLPYLHRLSERNLETIRQFQEEASADHAIQIILIAGAMCCTLICVTLVCYRIIKTRRAARQLSEMVAGIGSAEGGLNLEGVNQSQRSQNC